MQKTGIGLLKRKCMQSTAGSFFPFNCFPFFFFSGSTRTAKATGRSMEEIKDTLSDMQLLHCSFFPLPS